jgi:hypothetical protein
MDPLEKLNSLISQADERIAQVDETKLNEDQLKMIQEIKSKYPKTEIVKETEKDI